MDTWPRIPNQGSGQNPARGPGSTLPAPGTVVMASVEEDLGEGMYSLRWAGNRIAVTSRAALTPGQSLILKSETSPEGKLTLVVQGPALPDPSQLIRKPTYGPSGGRQNGGATGTGGQAVGGEMAAGVSRASATPAPQPLGSLLGLVLEPLDDFTVTAKMLLEQARADKELVETTLEKLKAKKKEEEQSDQPDELAEGNDESDPSGDPLAGGRRRPVASAAPDVRPASVQPGTGARPPQSGVAGLPAQPAGARADGAQPPAAPVAPPSGQAPAAEGARPAPTATGMPQTDQTSPSDTAESPGQQPAATPTGTARPLSPEAEQALRTAEESVPPETGSAVTSRAESAPAAAAPAQESPATRTESAKPAVVGMPPAAPAPTEPAVPPRGGMPVASESPPDQPVTDTGRGDGIKPEVLLKEALTQIVRAAELPLTSPSADSQVLGVGAKVPEAIADKAATILLRAAGLTPDSASLEAARALVDQNVQVDRATVQAMLALAAGVEGDDERAAMFKAAARLAAHDIPLAAPLAGGLADVLDRKTGVYELLDQASRALAVDDYLPEIKPLMDAARDMLNLLHVDLDRADAGAVLERYLSTFGREALGKALALIEASAQAVLESDPLLSRIDQAMTLILDRLDGSTAAGEAGDPRPDAGTRPAPSAVQPIPGEAPPQAVDPQPGLTPDGSQQPSPPPPASGMPPVPDGVSNPAVNAYLNAPRAFPGLDGLHLPPMPAVATLPAGTVDILVPLTPPPPTETAEASPAPPPGPPVTTLPAGDAPLPAPPPPPSMAPPMHAGHSPDARPAAPLPPELAQILDADQVDLATREHVLRRLDSLFQIPGANRPEIEILRPSGTLERFLAAGGGQGSMAGKSAEEFVRDVVSNDREKAEQALRALPEKDQATLKEAASRLGRMEREIIRANVQLGRLSEAAGTVRELGRQLLAVKAENLAGQERNPPVMLAEVPFKLADNGGDGRMQMFYRRGRGKQEGWTSRVILDLNTTGMGPVLGDMRFFNTGDMILNMFVESQETADFLSQSEAELAEHLQGKGFRLKSRFMVLPPPPPRPEIQTVRPEILDDPPPAESGSSTTRRVGRLDTRA